VHEVLHADWQDDLHLPQPLWARLSLLFKQPLYKGVICFTLKALLPFTLDFKTLYHTTLEF